MTLDCHHCDGPADRHNAVGDCYITVDFTYSLEGEAPLDALTHQNTLPFCSQSCMVEWVAEQGGRS
jgi:hypothetical protein